MLPGDIVLVDWRDAVLGSGEPNKRRPAIIVGSAEAFDGDFPFRMVVPLTSSLQMSVMRASTVIEPRPENGCTMRSYALSWNVHVVPTARLTSTSAKIRGEELATIREQIRLIVGS